MITHNSFAMLGFCSRMWSWSRHWTSWAGHLSSKFMQRLQYRNTKIAFPKYNYYVNQEIEFLIVKCFASMLIYAPWFNVSQFVLSTDFSTTRSFLFRTTRGLLKTRHMWAKLVIRCLSLLLWQANVGVVKHSVAKNCIHGVEPKLSLPLKTKQRRWQFGCHTVYARRFCTDSINFGHFSLI